MSLIGSIITVLALLGLMVGPFRRLPRAIQLYSNGSLNVRDTIDFYIVGNGTRLRELSKSQLTRRILLNYLENTVIVGFIIGINILVVSNLETKSP